MDFLRSLPASMLQQAKELVSELCFGNRPASTGVVSRRKRNCSPFEVKQACADIGLFATDKDSPA
jgi:hypothetical protein